MSTSGKTPKNHEAVIVAVWRERFVNRSNELENDRGGHDWYSLWVGLVLAHNQPALATWAEYIRLGFAVEVEEMGNERKHTKTPGGFPSVLQRQLSRLS